MRSESASSSPISRCHATWYSARRAAETSPAARARAAASPASWPGHHRVVDALPGVGIDEAARVAGHQHAVGVRPRERAAERKAKRLEVRRIRAPAHPALVAPPPPGSAGAARRACPFSSRLKNGTKKAHAGVDVRRSWGRRSRSRASPCSRRRRTWCRSRRRPARPAASPPWCRWRGPSSGKPRVRPASRAITLFTPSQPITRRAPNAPCPSRQRTVQRARSVALDVRSLAPLRSTSAPSARA